MTLKISNFLVKIAVLLFIAALSFADTEEKNDAASQDKVPVALDDTVGVAATEEYKDLPEFEEGVSVKVLDRHDKCLKRAAKNNWLQLTFVAKQMNDAGDAYEEFDSTISRKRQLLIQVDDKIKLPGLSEGLREVCAGEKREITIQAESPLMKADPKYGLKQPKMDRPAIYEVTVTAILDGEPVNIFAEMDVNNDQNLTKDEVRGYFNRFGYASEKELEKQVDQLMGSQDRDGDGIITFDEFKGPKYTHDEF